MRPSRVGPYELKDATVSMSACPFVPSASLPSAPVDVRRDSPEDVAPTARTFFPIAGDPMVQEVRNSSMSPSLPAANTSRFSWFCYWEGGEGGGGEGREEGTGEEGNSSRGAGGGM